MASSRRSRSCARLTLARRASRAARALDLIARGGGGATVTLNMQEADLPEELVAVQRTKVAPNGNVGPEGGLQPTGSRPSHVSVAVVWKVTTPSEALVTFQTTATDTCD